MNINNEKAALLVIDIQEDATGETARKPFPYANSAEFIERINALVDECTKSGMTVVYIANRLKNNFFYRRFVGRFIEGTPGCEFDKRLKVINSDAFEKHVGDAFSNPELDRFLKSNGIKNVYTCGLDAAGCVYHTSVGAVNNGYKAVVISDAVITLKMYNLPKLLEKYKMNGVEIK